MIMLLSLFIFSPNRAKKKPTIRLTSEGDCFVGQKIFKVFSLGASSTSWYKLGKCVGICDEGICLVCE